MTSLCKFDFPKAVITDIAQSKMLNQEIYGVGETWRVQKLPAGVTSMLISGKLERGREGAFIKKYVNLWRIGKGNKILVPTAKSVIVGYITSLDLYTEEGLSSFSFKILSVGNQPRGKLTDFVNRDAVGKEACEVTIGGVKLSGILISRKFSFSEKIFVAGGSNKDAVVTSVGTNPTRMSVEILIPPTNETPGNFGGSRDVLIVSAIGDPAVSSIKATGVIVGQTIRTSQSAQGTMIPIDIIANKVSIVEGTCG